MSWCYSEDRIDSVLYRSIQASSVPPPFPFVSPSLPSYRPCHVALAGLKLKAVLHQLSKQWDYRQEPAGWALKISFLVMVLINLNYGVCVCVSLACYVVLYRLL